MSHPIGCTDQRRADKGWTHAPWPPKQIKSKQIMCVFGLARWSCRYTLPPNKTCLIDSVTPTLQSLSYYISQLMIDPVPTIFL